MDETGPERETTFEEICGDMRTYLKALGVRLLMLKCNKRFTETEGYVGQQGEMAANIMLAYRHLEDARMRIGKILQAAGDGVSIFDKPPFSEGAQNAAT